MWSRKYILSKTTTTAEKKNSTKIMKQTNKCPGGEAIKIRNAL